MKEEAKKRLLLLDGSWGVMIQEFQAGRRGFPGRALRQSSVGAEGQQRPSHPDQAGDHPGYRPPVSGSRGGFHRDQHLQLELHQPGRLRPGPSGQRIERGRARSWRAICATSFPPPSRPRLVAGVLGPANRTATISPDVNDPAFRNITFDQLRETYRDGTRGLIKGGADVIMIETVFDTLNCKAAIYAIEEVLRGDGRAPAGLDFRHHHRSVGPHPDGPDADRLLAFGAPCRSLRHRAELRPGRQGIAPYIAELAGACDTLVSAHPNAGLPNEFGGYDEIPGTDGGDDRGIRPLRPGEHRRRLLRHQARPYRRLRRGHQKRHAARHSGQAQIYAPVGAGAVHADARTSTSSMSASAPTSPARPSSAS